jgi:hypothetical protein
MARIAPGIPRHTVQRENRRHGSENKYGVPGILRVGVVDPSGWVEALDGVREGEEVVVAPGRLADRRNEGRRVIVVRARPTGRSPAGAWQSALAEEAK